MYIYIYVYVYMQASAIFEAHAPPPKRTGGGRSCAGRLPRGGYRRLPYAKRELDALGVITISRGCSERCCSNKKTPLYHSNLSFVTLQNRRPTLFRAPAYRTPSEASLRRRCGHACRFLLRSPNHVFPLTDGGGSCPGRLPRSGHRRRWDPLQGRDRRLHEKDQPGRAGGGAYICVHLSVYLCVYICIHIYIYI